MLGYWFTVPSSDSRTRQLLWRAIRGIVRLLGCLAHHPARVVQARWRCEPGWSGTPGCSLSHTPTPALVACLTADQCWRASSVGGTPICCTRRWKAAAIARPATAAPAKAMTPPTPSMMAPARICSTLNSSFACGDWLLYIGTFLERLGMVAVSPPARALASPAESDTGAPPEPVKFPKILISN